MRVTVWALVLAACGPGTSVVDEDTDTETDVETDTDSDAESDDTEVVDCSTFVGEGTTISGVVKDTQGTLLTDSQVRVQYCRGATCLYPTCFSEGDFVFEQVEAGPGSFAIAPIGGGRFEPFVPVAIASAPLTLDAVVPTLAGEVTIPAVAAELAVGAGVYLTLGTGDLPGEPPLEPAPTKVAAIEALADASALEGFTGTAVALFYVHPFDSAAADDTTIPVRFDDAGWNLEGRGRLWVADYFTSAWIDLGPLEVDGDAKLVLADGGLPQLSTLLITRDDPPPTVR